MEWERIAEDDETKGDEWEEDSYGNPFRLPPADVIRSTYQTKHIDYGSAHPSVEGKKRSLCLAPPFPLLWLLLGSIALVRFGAPSSTKPVMNAPEQKKHHSSSSEPPYATEGRHRILTGRRPRRSKIIDRVADEDDDLVFVEQKKKLVVDVRDKDDLELYYKTIPDYFEQDDGRKLTEIPDRTSTDMIEGRY